MILNILMVGLGGIIGALLRYELSKHIKEKRDVIVPIETFIINTFGAFLLNLLSNPNIYRLISNDMKLFVITGFIGAFTTYSTFSHESISLIRDKHYLHAFIYIALTVIMGLLGAALGYFLGSIFR